MRDSQQETTSVQVGDLVPTWILDDDGHLVGVTMARVIGISDGGDAELEYPTADSCDTQRVDDASEAAK